MSSCQESKSRPAHEFHHPKNNYSSPFLGGALLAAAAEFKRDVEYGQAEGERLLLDVSVPDGPGSFPIAILIHGGGWGSGDKSGSNKPGDGADITPGLRS